MNEILMVFGGIFIFLILALIVIVPMLFIICMPQLKKCDKEAAALINELVPQIVDDWDYLKLRKIAPHLELSTTSEDLGKTSEDLGKFFNYCLRHLGKLKSYKGITAVKECKIEMGQGFIGDYVVEADFEKGAARIELQVIKRDNQWFINNFHVNSEAFVIASF